MVQSTATAPPAARLGATTSAATQPKMSVAPTGSKFLDESMSSGDLDELLSAPMGTRPGSLMSRGPQASRLAPPKPAAAPAPEPPVPRPTMIPAAATAVASAPPPVKKSAAHHAFDDFDDDDLELEDLGI